MLPRRVFLTFLCIGSFVTRKATHFPTRKYRARCFLDFAQNWGGRSVSTCCGVSFERMGADGGDEGFRGAFAVKIGGNGASGELYLALRPAEFVCALPVAKLRLFEVKSEPWRANTGGVLSVTARSRGGRFVCGTGQCFVLRPGQFWPHFGNHLPRLEQDLAKWVF